MVRNGHFKYPDRLALCDFNRDFGLETKTIFVEVDVEKDDDLQDLYVIALALDAGGDAATARKVRERICKGNAYLMKPLIVAQMEREAFSCLER